MEYRDYDPYKDHVRIDDWFVQTFFLFPFRWNLSPNWPIFLDTERMTKRWRDLRDKDLILGSAANNFVFTELGIKTAKNVKSRLSSPNLISRADSPKSDSSIVRQDLSQNDKMVLL